MRLPRFCFLLWVVYVLMPYACAQVNIYDYLRIKNQAQQPSSLVLKETYSVDRSKGAVYRRRFLLSREEYDLYGRPSLNIYYDHHGQMTSKIILFYPQRGVEKGIFKQQGEFMDSVIYRYNENGQRLSEIWYWGENRTADTLLYSYNASSGNLSKIYRKYDWDTKWDTLLYRDGLIHQYITYSQRGGMQKEVQLLYLADSSLLKSNTLNAAKMIIEEEFFFYNRRGQVFKTIVKLYPEGNEIIDPPQRISRHRYYPNGNLRRISRTDFSRAGVPVSHTLQRFLPSSYLRLQIERNRRERIYKKTIIDYTIQKNRNLLDVRG